MTALRLRLEKIQTVGLSALGILAVANIHAFSSGAVISDFQITPRPARSIAAVSAAIVDPTLTEHAVEQRTLPKLEAEPVAPAPVEEKPEVIAAVPAADPMDKPFTPATGMSADLNKLWLLDELLGGHPVQNVATREPFDMILREGIRHFERSTYRSPEYRDEFGYDMVFYDIVQNNGAKAYMMMFADDGEPTIAMLLPQQNQFEHIVFRSGQVKTHQVVDGVEALKSMREKMKVSVPFFSIMH